MADPFMTIPKPKFSKGQPVRWCYVYYLLSDGSEMWEVDYANALIQWDDLDLLDLEDAERRTNVYRGFVLDGDYPDQTMLFYGVEPEWVYQVEIENCICEETGLYKDVPSSIENIPERELTALLRPTRPKVIESPEISIFLDDTAQNLPKEQFRVHDSIYFHPAWIALLRNFQSAAEVATSVHNPTIVRNPRFITDFLDPNSPLLNQSQNNE